MTYHDPYEHMEEAWKLEANPFPNEAIREEGQPFSSEVFPDESLDFKRKLVRGALLGGRGIGFLWSQGRRSDTGFGKTTLMMETALEINRDLGDTVLGEAGMKPERRLPIAATYASLNNIDASGLYPVLFSAVVHAAKPREDGGPALLDLLRERLVHSVGDDAAAIQTLLTEARLRTAPGDPPLRGEVVSAFAIEGAAGVLRQLGLVSQMARLRNGLQYLDFLITTCAAARVDHLFVFVDQLEDLAQNKSITAAKRSREIGRIRDLQERPPYASRVHFVFTFHAQAARVLGTFWEQNRLPDFEASASNTAAVVVLRGLQTDEQVAALLKVYLEQRRLDAVEDPLLPFTPDALAVLREQSDERVGILLSRAHGVIEAAAQRGLAHIDGRFIADFLGGTLGSDDTTREEPDADADELAWRNSLDDLLRG